ncbi:hypothetical protein SDC9_21824 [bioreactor metagenome]|uniref:Uncharacterized protein n=1 Tax=bioreactor metagenome TaxID=1076179 RepID=A0A644UAH0_9ZZZZ|nr:hypothetical protein [Lentimicrobium sp.]MEA5111533.1 hypothetical protein [Lentimicrobium sp.]
MKTILSLSLILMFTFNGLNAKAFQPQQGATGDRLKALIDSARKEKSDSLRLVINNVFFNELTAYLKESPASNKMFDSLNIGVITSTEAKVTLFNWNLQQNNGTNIYFLIIRNNATNQVIPMKPMHALQELSEETIFRDANWPGGLYYRIIFRTDLSGSCYTLLGWDGFSRTTSRKTIDALSFDSNGSPVFGAPVFRTRDGIRNRVVSEYASQASFTQSYDRQKVTLSNVRKSQRKITDEIIVLDRLVPMNESLTGQRWAYVPAGNVYDGFIVFNKLWSFVEDIAPRNPAPSGKEKKSRKPVSYDLFPPQ